MLKHSAAEEAYREVLKRDPSNDLANLGLAVVFELVNRTEDLTRLISEAEARKVGADALNFIRAFDHRRGKRFAEGLEALGRVPVELESARRTNLLGQLEEGAGHYDAAFAAFERMNEIQREDLSQPEARAAAYRENVRRQMDLVTPEWAASWREAQVDGRPSPAFLVGFPRSGTTLLDTFLMGHPSTEVLEEEPMLRRAQLHLADFAALPVALDEEIRDARNAYFEAASKLTPLRPGALLIDKNPLAMNGLPLIRRLFPDAKIILAVRHPCDVVLSCFVTNFKPNDGMANFMRLETAAELYDLSFRYFERAREILKLPVHRVFYENIVADRDRELRALFDFLGLDWHEAVLDHETTAKSRGHIKTASYAQVVEPIYSRSAGRWRNYRKHLEAVLPILEPWVKKFGYEL
jgi:tetratricopeptide (TPR) repeat protein